MYRKLNVQKLFGSLKKFEDFGGEDEIHVFVWCLKCGMRFWKFQPSGSTIAMVSWIPYLKHMSISVQGGSYFLPGEVEK